MPQSHLHGRILEFPPHNTTASNSKPKLCSMHKEVRLWETKPNKFYAKSQQNVHVTIVAPCADNQIHILRWFGFLRLFDIMCFVAQGRSPMQQSRNGRSVSHIDPRRTRRGLKSRTSWPAVREALLLHFFWRLWRDRAERVTSRGSFGTTSIIVVRMQV
jgi:hypothetical protein